VPESQVGVYIISANRLLRESLARILNKRADLWAVSAQEVNEETAKSIQDSEAGILVFDSAAGILDGTEPIREFLSPPPRWKTILIGMEADERTFLETVRRGVIGYLLRDASAVDVVAAVRAVARGEVVCPPQLCRFLFQYVARQITEMPSRRVRSQIGLTRREQQLVPLIGRGLTNKEIAGHLNLSEQTVKNHIHHILHKVGAEDRLSVLEVCRTHGLEI
jgi:two-component system, NarL family, nitrate/nitrite response regulator NarL